ncbi:MAG TPA: (4Fe-4S)-binding protein [Flavobacteriaceae bacterium]|nr:(4Fe-4S)-binding protein [Flavobacteriaceae bacterium]
MADTGHKNREKPWIKPENATTKEIVEQVAKCPSGALRKKKLKYGNKNRTGRQRKKGTFCDI